MTAIASRPRVELRRLPLPALLVAAALPLALLVAVAPFVLGRLPLAPVATVGSVAPAFSLTDLEGDVVALEDYRGRPVIVNFWASWCVACVDEFPLLRQAVERHADDGLAVIGIVFQDRTAAARAFMERHGGTWTAAMDPDERAARAYGVIGPPQTYFIGRDGTIVARHIGQFSAASLEAKVAAILGHGE